MIAPYWLHIHRILIAATPIRNLRTPSAAEMNKRGSYSRRPWNYLLNPLSVFPPFPLLLNPYHAGYWSILFAFICVKIYVSVATDFWRRCLANLRSWRLDLFLDLGGCFSGKPGISKLCCMNPSISFLISQKSSWDSVNSRINAMYYSNSEKEKKPTSLDYLSA